MSMEPTPRDLLEARLDDVIGDAGQLARAHRAGNGDRHDRRGADVELLDDGGFEVGRQLGQDGETLSRTSCAAWSALRSSSNSSTSWPTFSRLGRAHALETAECVQALLELVDDLLFDGTRVGAGVDRQDREDGELDAREEIDADTAAASSRGRGFAASPASAGVARAAPTWAGPSAASAGASVVPPMVTGTAADGSVAPSSARSQAPRDRVSAELSKRTARADWATSLT
jgi:hypothetical protein